MAYVYILSDHDESGADNVRATLDRDLLPSMIVNGWPDLSDREREEAITRLGELLNDPDRTVIVHGKSLTKNWGSVQLHVVDLERD